MTYQFGLEITSVYALQRVVIRNSNCPVICYASCTSKFNSKTFFPDMINDLSFSMGSNCNLKTERERERERGGGEM